MAVETESTAPVPSSRSSRHHTIAAEAMQTARAVADALQEDVWCYVTTNPELCSGFGIKAKDVPTAVLHGTDGGRGGGRRGRTVILSHPNLVYMENAYRDRKLMHKVAVWASSRRGRLREQAARRGVGGVRRGQRGELRPSPRRTGSCAERGRVCG